MKLCWTLRSLKFVSATPGGKTVQLHTLLLIPLNFSINKQTNLWSHTANPHDFKTGL